MTLMMIISTMLNMLVMAMLMTVVMMMLLMMMTMIVKSTRSHQVHQSKILADIRLNSDRGGRAEVRLSCQKEQGSSEGATTRKAGFSVQVQTSGGGAALRTLQAWGLTLYIQGPWGFRVFRGRTGLPSSHW